MSSTVELVWATPNIDENLAYIARVSNPANQANPSITKLLAYMLEHGHVSPFEMASVCLEINTTRDIGRQILRHRSFSFQEFSQRYQDVELIGHVQPKELRVQDLKNRQSSLASEDKELASWWNLAQREVADLAYYNYSQALKKGVAKELARVVLPEGLTATRMYMSGTLRSWIHYLQSRLDPSTQKEHREIAERVLWHLRSVAPVVMEAVFGAAKDGS